MVGTRGLNSGFVHGDNSAVGVGHQAVTVSGSVAVRCNSGSSVKSTTSSEVIGTGGGNSGLVNGNNGSVGVGDEVGVQVEGAGVAVANSWDGGDGGGDGGSSNGRGSDSNRGNGSVLGIPGGEVVGTGGSNSWLINGDNSTVGVANQVGVQVEGASVAIAGSVDGSGSNGGSSCCVADTGISKGSTSTTGSKVVGTGGSNCGLVDGDDGAVGVADQAVLGCGEGDTRGENLKFNFKAFSRSTLDYQELHCCFQLCARAQTEENRPLLSFILV